MIFILQAKSYEILSKFPGNFFLNVENVSENLESLEILKKVCEIS